MRALQWVGSVFAMMFALVGWVMFLRAITTTIPALQYWWVVLGLIMIVTGLIDYRASTRRR